MSRQTIWLFVGALLGSGAIAISGCSSSSTKSSASASSTEAATAKELIPGADLSPWDLAKIESAWTGAWVIKENGSFHAWEIKGKELTWVGDSPFPGTAKGTPVTVTLELQAPCRMTLSKDANGGGKYGAPFEFTVLNGKLRASRNGGGFIKGDDAVYCEASGAVFRLAKSGCKVFKLELGGGGQSWAESPGKCAMVESDGKKCFSTTGAVASPSDCIEVVGEALVPQGTAPIEAKDFEAAKTAAAELNAKRP